MKLIILIILFISIAAYSKSINQNDFVLDHKKWVCTLYGKHFRLSKEEIGESGVYQYWIGSIRDCVRYEKIGRM